MELRPIQEKSFQKLNEFINSKTNLHAVFVYPTGYGKSILISHLAKKYKDKYFINVTNNKELVKQNFDKYVAYGFEASICSSSLKEVEVGNVTFATIGTLIKFADFFKDKEVILIDDECDQGSAIASQLDKFIKQLNNYKLLGLSATPFRLHTNGYGSFIKMLNKDSNCLYNYIYDVVQISEVVELGYWSDIVYDVREVSTENLIPNIASLEYSDEQIKQFEEDNDITHQVIKTAQDLINEGRKSILVCVNSIVTAQYLCSKIENSVCVYSGMKDKDRDDAVNGFKSGKYKVAVQCKILSIGFDHPLLDAIIIARPTNSLSSWYQTCGRGVRKHPEKQNCKIVDLSGTYKKFGDIRDLKIEEISKYGWALLKNDILMSDVPIQSKRVVTKQDILNNNGKVPSKLENSELETVISVGKYKGKKLSQIIYKDARYLRWMFENKVGGEQLVKILEKLFY